MVRFILKEKEIGIFYLDREEKEAVETFVEQLLESEKLARFQSGFLRSVVETEANLKWVSIGSDLLEKWYDCIKQYGCKIAIGSGGAGVVDALEKRRLSIQNVLYAPIKRVRDENGKYLYFANTKTGFEYGGELYSLDNESLVEKNLFPASVALLDDVIYSGRTMEAVLKYLDDKDVALFAIINIKNSSKALKNPIISIYDVVESENSYSYLAFNIIRKYGL